MQSSILYTGMLYHYNWVVWTPIEIMKLIIDSIQYIGMIDVLLLGNPDIYCDLCDFK